MEFTTESKCNEFCLSTMNSLYQNNELKKNLNKHEYGFILTLIIWCNELIFLIILKSAFTDALHFPSVSPSQIWFIILIQFITLKNNWMNPCMKTDEKCNESKNNELKIMRKSNSLDQIMRVSRKWN